MQQLADNIRTIRKMKGMKQPELAKAINKHQQAISKIENGQTKIKPEVKEQIATYFGMEQDELENFHEKMVFHITQNPHSNNGYNNMLPENERKAYEDHINSLKEQLIEIKEEKANLKIENKQFQEEIQKLKAIL